MNKLENLVELSKWNEILGKKEDKKNVIVIVLAVIGAIVAIAAIAYAVYRYLHPAYLKDFEDEFEDEFNDMDDDEDFFVDEGVN